MALNFNGDVKNNLARQIILNLSWIIPLIIVLIQTIAFWVHYRSVIKSKKEQIRDDIIQKKRHSVRLSSPTTSLVPDPLSLLQSINAPINTPLPNTPSPKDNFPSLETNDNQSTTPRFHSSLSNIFIHAKIYKPSSQLSNTSITSMPKSYKKS